MKRIFLAPNSSRTQHTPSDKTVRGDIMLVKTPARHDPASLRYVTLQNTPSCQTHTHTRLSALLPVCQSVTKIIWCKWLPSGNGDAGQSKGAPDKGLTGRDLERRGACERRGARERAKTRERAREGEPERENERRE